MCNPSVLRLSRWAKMAFASVVLLGSGALCHAQSCALCYTQAAAAGQRFIHGLRAGILVLIVPPMFMSVGITILAYRKRNRFHQANSAPESRDDW